MSGRDVGTFLEHKLAGTVRADDLVRVFIDMKKDVRMAKRATTTVTGNCHGLNFEDFVIHGALHRLPRLIARIL